MAISEKETIMVGDSKYGVTVNEYNGSISLNKVEKGSNEVLYQQWVFLSKWQNGGAVPDDKKRPMGIWLGEDKAQAVQYLRQLASIIQGIPEKEEAPAPRTMANPPIGSDNDDIPF